MTSAELQKYPYCCRFETEDDDYLSEKICCYIIKIRKKIIKKATWLIVYSECILSLSNGIIPSQAIGLPIPLQTSTMMRVNDSNADFDSSKQKIIADLIREMPAEVDFTKTEMNKLYHLSVKYANNSLNQEELITRITNLRGGDFVDIAQGLALIAIYVIGILQSEANAFQQNLNGNAPPPPHLGWIYGNNYQPGQFGFGKGSGPRSITVNGIAQNAGSDKKDPSSGSYDLIDIMKQLRKQMRNENIEIQVGDQIYMLENLFHKDENELTTQLAEKIYDSIRACDTDICDIAENLGFKAVNIKNIKDHVFYNIHTLDRYVKQGEEIKYKRFDPSLEQGLAWKRIETGNHTFEDVIWLKHECAERHHELKYNSGYTESHDRAQSRFDGFPWTTDNKF